MLGLVLRGGIMLSAAGLALGLAGSLVTTRLMESLLYGVTPFDPPAFAAAGLALLAVSAGACVLPALRATRIDPVRALRADP